MRSVSILVFLGLKLCLVVASNLNVHHYDIKIMDIDEQMSLVLGVVNINVNLKNGTEFEIHQQNITMTTIEIGGIECIESNHDENTQISVVTCENAKPGPQNLTITYVWSISTDMEGFYVSKYNGNDGTKSLLATQFEPTYARRFFPCFDEPELKATFQRTVSHNKKFTPLSNTPVISTTPTDNDNVTETKFEVTPPISIYLLALILSEFVFTNGTENYKYTETAAKKSDWVATPDFAWGAMENWGLVTIRESDLLDKAGTAKLLVFESHVQKLKDFIQEMAKSSVKWSSEKFVDLQKLFSKPADSANSIIYPFGIIIAVIIFLISS